MRKKQRKIIFVSLLTGLLLLMSGCGLLTEKTNNEIDPPQEVNFLDDGESLEETGEDKDALADGKDAPAGATESHQLQVYLIDENGLVVPQTMKMPSAEDPAKQVVEYLVNDGKASNYIPNGMRAVLPAGTEVLGMNIDQGTATVDFSKEFKEYAAEDELRILQSLTYTLTQFDNVHAVKIKINGEDQKVMPVNQTPIGENMTRADGINIETNGVVDVTGSKTVTVYFIGQNGDDEFYYVPVTRKVNSNENLVKATVDELLNGPSIQSGLLTDMRNEAELVSAPVEEGGVVTLDFNEAILGEQKNTAISDAVLNSLVLSLTELTGIEKVQIKVNGTNEVVSQDGKLLTEPVSRPVNVNTVEF
ncbi:GerMN domain-containing protein [Pseudalkalibacillus salsuginis]|uniref:GerMN domain-containing protein n=1 Tax=Pseudalkalibacillus salsuginis TaxID=2910972 RepID=UPI001F3B43A7|nr:GerMN domain-containing protein [Pseudalkalibacillus salsuginis]MCF6408694.1 GerMN domain-containing protein [Pseudalkalibacillus salsuginis]